MRFLKDLPRCMLYPRDGSIMVSKIHLLLLSTLGVLLCSLPAQAANLLGWRFNEAQNRLEFNTDGDVQPRAQLIFNPTRVVVDLPETRLDQPVVNESMAGTIRSYRIGQLDANTTRIMIEIAEGYSLDPSKVKVRGLTQNQWVVDLPQPQPLASNNKSTTPISESASGSARETVPPLKQPLAQSGPLVDAPTQVNEVRSTPDGLFVRLAGESPRVKITRSRDRRTIDINIRNASLGSSQIPLPDDAAKLGIQQISTEQRRGQPPEAHILLQVPADAPDWKASVSNFGGIVLLPLGRPNGEAGANNPASNPTSNPASNPGGNSGGTTAQRPNSETLGQVATLQAVAIDRGRNQLMLQVDQPASYSSRQEGGDYILTLSPARLGPGVKDPAIYVGDRLRRVRITQRGPQNVEIRITPDRGVGIGEVQVPSQNLLSLPLQRNLVADASRPIPTTGPGNNSTGGKTGPIKVIPPVGQPAPPSRPIYSPNPNLQLPAPNGRAVVVIDPGHGGPDPGAVGNGLRETDIVLDISRQVTGFLEAQGVQVIMTRNGEYDLDLQPRVDIADRARATVFVSIHANAISLSRPEVNGVETYYYDSGKALAQSIHNSVLENVDIKDRGLRSARFYVLRRTSMPAALVETGFITGGEDKYKLADPVFRTQMAKAISLGILRYLQ
jgi:N-acetylmuramoyl-L-alanine amidase